MNGEGRGEVAGPRGVHDNVFLDVTSQGCQIKKIKGQICP